MVDSINTLIEDTSFGKILASLHKTMQRRGHIVHPAYWQGMGVANKPDMQSHELLNVTIHVEQLTEDLPTLQEDIKPNLPWADDHFKERVGGTPLNPGEQWKNWPWASSADRFRNIEQRFNHTYMERYWPKYARIMPDDHNFVSAHSGIGWDYGDLNDLVDLMVKDPLTRQAWIPIFHPEDTGVGDGGRKPCTLGYQFIVRDDKLHTYYPLRSCDLIRHCRDDIYLTVRLALWVLTSLREKNPYFKKVNIGSYTQFMTSLHVFENDMASL